MVCFEEGPKGSKRKDLGDLGKCKFGKIERCGDIGWYSHLAIPHA